MNEDGNAKLIERFYEKLKEGEVDSILKSFATNIEWELPDMDNVPFGGVWRGHDGVRKFFSKVFELQDVLKFEPQKYFVHDHEVVVLGQFSMRLKSTRRVFSSPWAHVWTMRNGKVTRFYEYVDTAVVSQAHAEAQRSQETDANTDFS